MKIAEALDLLNRDLALILVLARWPGRLTWKPHLRKRWTSWFRSWFDRSTSSRLTTNGINSLPFAL